MITTNYYKGSPPRRPPSSRARVFARPRTPRSPNTHDPIPSPAKKNTARTQSTFAPVARAPSSNPLPRRVALSRRPSSLVDARRRPRSTVALARRRSTSCTPPSVASRSARSRTRPRARRRRSRAGRTRATRTRRPRCPTRGTTRRTRAIGRRSTCVYVTRRARPRRAIDRATPRRARAIDRSIRRDANSTTDARRDARDATQVVFAVLGGWAVVIAGARSALS